MLKFIFKNGNRTVSAGAVMSSPSSKRLYLGFTETVGPLTCPNHGDGCIATILLDTASPGSDWQIIGSCCPEYKQIVESAAPSHQNANM